ncbi:MAG: bifunctional riboflavin kinase/FAD synthetase [Lachnospiraceae bacterium]|nr:bifunctional riboflavin kinase/FAD synthetase [Lachnospiraceae bacterium]
MIYIDDTTDFYSDQPSAVTLGKFDGLHRGHQKLLKKVKYLQRQGFRGIVFSIAPEKVPVLLTSEEKRAMVEEQGMDCMIKCPFIPEVLSMDPETFLADVLIKKLHAEHIVVGTDFRFGYKRTGDVRLLGLLQKKYGFTLHVIEKECFQGREISSTYVKEALAGADMELVTELLGYTYPVSGIVRHGRQLGRRIGMPTVNLVPEERKLMPPPGVYFSRTEVGESTYCGVTNIGYKPTVDGSFLGAETYLYGTHENLYDREIKVSLLRFRRQERKFGSVEELKAQMEKDILAGKEYFRVS